MENEGLIDRKRREHADALRRGEAFIRSIFKGPPVVVPPEDGEPPDDGFFYFSDVSFLDGSVANIIITNEIAEFWSMCINVVTGRLRVCATGSPGIGKSTTMMYLIYLLVLGGKKVVYLERSPDKSRFYYEWKIEDGGMSTKVYPEKSDIRDVIKRHSPDFNETYYLCDPGQTDDSCLPGDEFLVNIILNASADDTHWGGNEFRKFRTENKAMGTIVTYPMMKKKQIFQAREFFRNSTDIDDQILESRHRQFGSIPRFLFGPEQRIRNEQLVIQDATLSALSTDMARRVMNNMAGLNNNDVAAPKASIMCITSSPPDFVRTTASFVSDRVAKRAAKTHMHNLWNDISAQDNSTTRGHLFEAYVRSLFLTEETKFRCRSCHGKSSKLYKEFFDEELGRCTDIRRTTDIIGDCKTGPDGIIFYSYNESEPLVDFMYKFGKKYYAIQVTTSAEHDCAADKMENFLADLDLQSDEELNLVYTVPDGVFGRFTTNPVRPEVPRGVAGDVFIFHAEIKRPPAI